MILKMKVIREFFDELDLENYNKLVDLSFDLLHFREIKKEDLNKKIYLEKLYDYLYILNLKQSFTKDKDDLLAYTTVLFNLLNKKDVKKGSRAERYFDKLDEIRNSLKKSNKLDVELLKDFTRVFIALYIGTNENKCPITNVSFSFSYEVFVKSIDYLKSEKKGALLPGKKANLVDDNDRYSKENFVLYLYEIICLNMLSDRG